MMVNSMELTEGGPFTREDPADVCKKSCQLEGRTLASQIYNEQICNNWPGLAREVTLIVRDLT